MNRIIRASKKNPCPVCGGKKWPCYAFASGEVVGCANVASDKTDRDGLYLHVLVTRDNHMKGAGNKPTPRPTPKPSTPRASAATPDHLHLVYSSLLDHMGLSGERRANLLARGLTPQSIERNGYRDTPTSEQSDELVRSLEPLGLGGVPGFYFRSGRWKIVNCLPGYFVPYRDIDGRISGLSYRLDVPIEKTKYLWLSSNPDAAFADGSQKYPGGSKLTPPLHFARPELISVSRDILLTEGSLKAQIASELLGLPFIGAGGVTQWGDGFAEKFKQLFPGKRAVLAYDSDFRSNEHVRRALETLMARMRDAGVRYVVRSWPRHDAKGIDDLALMLSQSADKEVLAA